MKKFKIFYFSPYDLLRPRTNQISDVRFCEAFKENNCEVELLCPTVLRKDNLPKNTILDYYEVKNKFNIQFIDTQFKTEEISKLNYLRLSFIYFLKVFRSKTSEKFCIISRSEILLFYVIFFKKIGLLRNAIIIPWLHELKKGNVHKWIYNNSDFYLATNSTILEDLGHFLVKKIESEITLNPISEENIAFQLEKSAARKNIHYFSEKPLVVYTGKLFIQQKEINYIIESAKLLPEVNFIFTGGKPNVVAHYLNEFKVKNIQNIQLSGYLSDYRMIKNYQKAADILVSYYTEYEHNVRYNFPNKICEYMLSKNPIITPFFSATKDLINESNAFHVEEENSKALAEKIKEVLSNPKLMEEKATIAYKDVLEISYSKVANKIIQKLHENHIK